MKIAMLIAATLTLISCESPRQIRDDIVVGAIGGGYICMDDPWQAQGPHKCVACATNKALCLEILHADAGYWPTRR